MINIKDLKLKIENHSYDYPLLILIKGTKETTTFLCNQYVNEILSHQPEVLFMDNVDDIISERNNIFNDSQNFIYCVLSEFDNVSETLKRYDGILIVCDKMSAESKRVYDDYVVELPELENWHIKDYITSVSHLTDDDSNFLIKKCDSIFRIKNELDKVSIFEEDKHKYIFDLLKSDNFLSDCTDYDVFNLANPIVNKSYSDLMFAWRDAKLFDSDPMLLLSVLINQYKTIIDVFLYPNSTPEICGISPKRFNAIKYYNKNYTKKQLTDVYQFLTDVDRALKMGELSDINLLDYIIINVVQKGNQA